MRREGREGRTRVRQTRRVESVSGVVVRHGASVESDRPGECGDTLRLSLTTTPTTTIQRSQHIAIHQNTYQDFLAAYNADYDDYRDDRGRQRSQDPQLQFQSPRPCSSTSAPPATTTMPKTTTTTTTTIDDAVCVHDHGHPLPRPRTSAR
jgi:hypothetical protein